MLFRSFIWGDEEEERKKIHWVRWDRLCLALEKGGLGCKYLLAMNVALRGKWLWSRIGRVVENGGCGETWGEGKWIPMATRGSYDISLWKSIMDEWEELSKGMRLKPAGGKTILFWYDV